MNVFPNLYTRRLHLRKLSFKDIPYVKKYANNKTISDNILNIKLPYSIEDTISWMNSSLEGFKNKSRYSFAISFKNSSNNEFIGVISLVVNKEHCLAQMAYWIGEPFWGKGITTEATEEVVKFGFEVLRLNKIYATCFEKNEISAKILRKCGMVKEGVLKKHYKPAGVYANLCHYGILFEEYSKIKLQNN